MAGTYNSTNANLKSKTKDKHIKGEGLLLGLMLWNTGWVENAWRRVSHKQSEHSSYFHAPCTTPPQKCPPRCKARPITCNETKPRTQTSTPATEWGTARRSALEATTSQLNQTPACIFDSTGRLQSKRFVLSINAIVASRMIRFATTFNWGLPNKNRLHRAIESKFVLSRPGISVSWPKRSLRIGLNRWQCRRKCWLSSMAHPHAHIGLRQSKLCRNLCSFKGLNSIRSFVKRLIPTIS